MRTAYGRETLYLGEQQGNTFEGSAMDFTRHNEEQAAVWAAYYAGTPTRVPMTIACTPRMVLLDPALNPEGVTFRDCFDDPAVMFDIDLRFKHWYHTQVPADIPRGAEAQAQWTVWPNFQNVSDAAWFGAELHFLDGEVPDTRPFLTDDNKRLLFDRGLPDPFGGFMGKAKAFLEYFQERAEGLTFHDRPVVCANESPGLSFDGPLTVACNLRGATEFCLDLYEDPDYAQELLTYITDAVIARNRAWRDYLGQSQVLEARWFADDSIALLSVDAYREHILPHHRRFLTTDTVPGAPVHFHLCGDSTRHFVTIRNELNCRGFDTGYPIDHGRMRTELGPEIELQGGPTADLLRFGTPADVAADTRRILRSGVMTGGKFVLKEANNLAPRTPIVNLQAMYDMCREEGQY